MCKPQWRSSLTGAMAAVAVFGLTVPAHASELDDLKRQVESLLNRIVELEARQAETAKNAEEARKAAERLPLMAPQRAVTSGKDRIKLTVSGQVNRAVSFVDAGQESQVLNVDNDNSSTRVRWVGTGRLNDDITAGALVEVQFESNSSAVADVDQDGELGPNNFSERHLTFWLDSERFGRIWAGQGDTASNGTSEVDLSGTAVVAYSGIADSAGGVSFFNSATGARIVGTTIGATWNQFDGLSRRDRVRYDTPKFHGLQASSSFSQGDMWDVALRYSADFEAIDTKVAAAIAYADTAQRFDFEQVNGSFSALHDSGVNLTVAAGGRDLDARDGEDDPMSWYVKLGYQRQFFDLGKTALAVDFGAADDVQLVGDEFETWGLAGVQNFDRIATELYLLYRNHDLDRPETPTDDIDVVFAGGRVKF